MPFNRHGGDLKDDAEQPEGSNIEAGHTISDAICCSNRRRLRGEGACDYNAASRGGTPI